MDLAIYAHPWDLRALGAHGGLPRLRDLGFAEVALAVSYHAGRWLTPWHPDGMVRFLEDGTVHYRPAGDYGLLQPRRSSEVPATGPSPLEWLCAEAPKAGLKARAWTVLTHNSRLGEGHPECCVENALGDRYSYALCPANGHVQQYVQAMVADLTAHAGLAAIELEASGWMGHRHNSHHDKSSWAPELWTDFLLSACFCGSCRQGMAAMKYEDGVVGDAFVSSLRSNVAAALRRHFADGDCLQPAAAKLDAAGLVERLRREFGPQAMVVLGHRVAAPMHGLLASRQRCLSAKQRLSVQAHYDALRGGAALPFAVLGGFVDEAALTVYGESADGVAVALPHLVAARGAATRPPVQPEHWPLLRLCLHPRAPQYRSDDDLRKVKDLCLQHQVAAVSIYHLGLLPWRTIERVATVFRS